MALSTRATMATKAAVARRNGSMLPARPALRASPVARAKVGKVNIDSEALQAKATEFANSTAAVLKEKWEKTEDKPAAVLIISGTVIALSAAFSVVSIVDKIPLVSDVIELVGIGVTGWFTYRYLTVGPDRDELFVAIKEFITKVYGKL